MSTKWHISYGESYKYLSDLFRLFGSLITSNGEIDIQVIV